jgi:hypothetical protein
MSQNLLNDFVGNAEPVKIRSRPAPKRVPAVPRNLLRFESGLNHFSHQCVEVQRVAQRFRKINPGRIFRRSSVPVEKKFRKPPLRIKVLRVGQQHVVRRKQEMRQQSVGRALSSADPMQVTAKIVSLIDTVRYINWPRRLILYMLSRIYCRAAPRTRRTRPCRYAQSCVLASGDHFVPQSPASANRAGFTVWFRRGVVMPGSVPEAVQLADMQRL